MLGLERCQRAHRRTRERDPLCWSLIFVSILRRFAPLTSPISPFSALLYRSRRSSTILCPASHRSTIPLPLIHSYNFAPGFKMSRFGRNSYETSSKVRSKLGVAIFTGRHTRMDEPHHRSTRSSR
ncbi:hypothetical protein BD311DRAFT_412621 [Dichomitus squalens]|uniref:Uncharacterized protein n=1 Tax=Dichomitus squalens TaxID=114155 RepID=A0A4Q9MKW1_9APHY|nr:hypothetical protein BD311DRAFT_412621 [Dichomitus squalens]